MGAVGAHPTSSHAVTLQNMAPPMKIFIGHSGYGIQTRLVMLRCCATAADTPQVGIGTHRASLMSKARPRAGPVAGLSVEAGERSICPHRAGSYFGS